MKDSITKLVKETIITQAIKENHPYLGITLTIFDQPIDEAKYKELGYNYPLRQTLDYIFFRDIPDYFKINGYDHETRKS